MNSSFDGRPVLDVAWATPEGGQTPAGSAEARVDVARGVSIAVAFEALDPAGVVVELTLSGHARFIIIPLSESALLVAVAEPSAEAVNLMPVASTPVWLGAAGDRMPTEVGSLAAGRPEDAGLVLELIPGPEEMAVCALRISSAPPPGQPVGSGQRSPALSILRLSEGIVRISGGSSK